MEEAKEHSHLRGLFAPLKVNCSRVVSPTSGKNLSLLDPLLFRLKRSFSKAKNEFISNQFISFLLSKICGVQFGLKLSQN